MAHALALEERRIDKADIPGRFRLWEATRGCTPIRGKHAPNKPELPASRDTRNDF